MWAYRAYYKNTIYRESVVSGVQWMVGSLVGAAVVGRAPGKKGFYQNTYYDSVFYIKLLLNIYQLDYLGQVRLGQVSQVSQVSIYIQYHCIYLCSSYLILYSLKTEITITMFFYSTALLSYSQLLYSISITITYQYEYFQYQYQCIGLYSSILVSFV